MKLVRFPPLPLGFHQVGSLGAGLAERLGRYHPELAARGLLVGLLVAIGFAIVGRGPVVGRLALVVVVSVVAQIYHGVVALAVGPGFAALLIVVAAIKALAPAPPPRADVALLGPLLLISLAGVWAAVPDTEPALIAAAVLVAPLCAGQLHPARSIDRVAAIAAVVVAGVAGSQGADGHGLVGGLTCVGLMIAPLRRIQRPAITPVEIGVTFSVEHRVAGRVAALHLAVVFVSARVLTRWDVGPAVVGAFAMAAVVCGVWPVVVRSVATGSLPGPSRDAPDS